jgi:hypothetical protein
MIEVICDTNPPLASKTEENYKNVFGKSGAE